MKKLLLSVILAVSLCFSTNISQEVFSAETATTVQWDSQAALNRVNTIGHKLMEANNLPTTIEFKVSNEEDINAYANLNKEVYVYRGLLDYVTDDNELAAVISHELGHIINGHCAKQTLANSVISSLGSKINPTTETGNLALSVSQNLVSSKLSRQDEFEADLTGTDLLVKAGYNPLAMISVLNKICGNYMDILSTHPSGEKRLYNIYDYVDYNYNNYIKTGYNSDSYTQSKTLINNYVSERANNPKKLAKFKKEQEKLKVKKNKREVKMSKNGSNPWDVSLNALQLMMQ